MELSTNFDFANFGTKASLQIWKGLKKGVPAEDRGLTRRQGFLCSRDHAMDPSRIYIYMYIYIYTHSWVSTYVCLSVRLHTWESKEFVTMLMSDHW